MALTKVKLIADGVVDVDHLAANHGITTDNIGEGSNLYYTDARVSTYLSTNSYATEGYVTTAVANLVDSAPTTLDTLNELAAALGDDPNFATTVTNSIATKLPLAGGTLTGALTVNGDITSSANEGKLILNSTATNGKQYQFISIDTGNLGLYDGTAYRLWVGGNGNVGIGTTSPIGKLNIQQSSLNTAALFIGRYNAEDSPIIQIGESTAFSGTGSYGEALIASRNRDIVFSTGDFQSLSSVNTAALIIEKGEGNVGIGTTTPGSKLHVGSTGANAYSSTITKGSNMKGVITTLSNNTDDMVGIYFATGSTTEGTHWSGITGSRSDNASHWGTQLNFYTHDNDVNALNDATQKMVIKGDGKVGIGTVSPQNNLHIETTSPTIRLSDTDASNLTQVSSTIQYWQGNNTARAGYIGYGTTSNSSLTIKNEISDGDVIIAAGDQERVWFHSNGNTGFATSLNYGRLNIIGYDEFGINIIDQRTSSSGVFSSGITFRDYYLAEAASIDFYHNQYFGSGVRRIGFNVSGGEKMSIKHDGTVLIGTASNPSGNNAKTVIGGIGSATGDGLVIGGYASNEMLVLHSRYDQAAGGVIFKRGDVSTTNIVGSIRFTSTSTSFNTSSDYRLKENVVEMTGALDRVDALKPSRFNFIADPENTVDGFLAHEVAEVIPEAVNGEKDAVDEEGNPIYQGIDQSKIVPLLVAAIKELKVEVEALKQQLNG